MLSYLFIIFFFFFLLLLFIPNTNIILLKKISLIGSFFLLNYLLGLILFFDILNINFQFLSFFNWSNILNFNYNLSVDGVSFIFLVLTALLFPLCILSSWYNIKYKLKEFLIILYLIEFFLLNIFCINDFFFFYIFFESVLIPMIFLIGVWGSRQRKIHAVYLLFFYTILGSIFMLISLLFLYSQYLSLDIRILLTNEISYEREFLIWPALFLSFAIKVPIFPFHIWLPEAHVEAPTVGSVILAGILLKLGTYGLYRFLLPVLPTATYYFSNFVYILCIVAILYCSLIILRQFDIKKIIAYSSVVHMNYVILGLFSLNLQSVSGSLFLMFSHGIVSSALFFCIGFLYDRFKTRNLKYFGGLIWVMPLYSFILFILILANISFPGTSNFIGEFLVLLGLTEINLFLVFIGLIGVIFGACYSIWFYNRLIFGVLIIKSKIKYIDLSFRELCILLILIFFIFAWGLVPNSVIDYYYMNLYYFINIRV